MAKVMHRIGCGSWYSNLKRHLIWNKLICFSGNLVVVFFLEFHLTFSMRTMENCRVIYWGVFSTCRVRLELWYKSKKGTWTTVSLKSLIQKNGALICIARLCSWQKCLEFMKPKSSDINKRDSQYTIKGTYWNMSKSSKNIFYLPT